MSTDFFDDDLVNEDGEAPEEERLREDEPVESEEARLTRLAQQREQLNAQVADATDEITRLQQRQLDLERERENLEDLGRRQERYERDKAGVQRSLAGSLALLEKEQAEATRMVELLSETRARFTGMLEEIEGIDEESWSDDHFDTELSRAMVMVEIAKRDFEKAMAKIDAAALHKTATSKKLAKVAEGAMPDVIPARGFGYWLKAGLAASLPGIVTAVVLFVLWLLVSSGIWMP